MPENAVRPALPRPTRLAGAAALAAGIAAAGIAPAYAGATFFGSVPLGSVSLGSLSLGSSGLGSAEAAPVDAPRLASVDNFRDVAGVGEGYALPDGRHLRKGVLYRSNAVHPDAADLATLTGLGLTAVYDLRTPDAVAEEPDLLPGGVRYTNIDIFGRDLESEGARSIRSAADARAFMESMNRGFVVNDHERSALARVFTALANTDGPQLFHCNSGKDRTGWVAAVLQGIAGTDRETILGDYLLTNEYAPMMGVERSYLEAGLAALDAEYGDMNGYLTDGLGLSPDTVATLRAKLTA